MPSGFFLKHVSSYILDPKDPKDPKDSSYTHQTILLMQLHLFFVHAQKGLSKAGRNGLVCAQRAELKVGNNTCGQVLSHRRAILPQDMPMQIKGVLDGELQSSEYPVEILEPLRHASHHCISCGTAFDCCVVLEEQVFVRRKHGIIESLYKRAAFF